MKIAFIDTLRFALNLNGFLSVRQVSLIGRGRGQGLKFIWAARTLNRQMIAVDHPLTQVIRGRLWHMALMEKF